MSNGIFFAPDSTDLVYFNHRLNLVGQAPNVPASVAFDMARSPMSTDQLHGIAQQFGAPAPGNGWGLSSFLDHLVSSQPDKIPVNDLATLQNNLKTQGYLPPTYTATGEWTPEAASAFRRFESDASQSMYSGDHPNSFSFQHAMTILGWTLPSRVFQGLVGAAKGFVTQAPETVERVGALGGAAAGAAIGTAIAPGPGTAIGAVAGGVIGFLGDLFSHDPSEGNQSEIAKLLDALTPYEEYRSQGGAQKFFEDLGWTLTAVSLLKGGIGSAEGGFGVLGAKAGVTGIEDAAAASGDSFFSTALAKGTNDEMGLSAKALLKPVQYFSSDAHTQLAEWWKGINFLSQTTRPILKDVAIPMYTGLSAAQFGARAFSNLGAGSTDSTIRQAIDSAPLPRTGIDVPFLGDPVDWAGFVVYPQRFFPWKLGDLSKGAQAMLGESDAAFTPLVNWYRWRSPGTSLGAAKSAVKDLLGSDPAEQLSNLTMLHLEHGVESMAMKKMAGIERWRPDWYQRLETAKYQIRGQIIDEVGGNHPLSAAAQAIEDRRAGTSLSDTAPTLKEAMSYAYYDPMDPSKGPGMFSAYLDRLAQDGAGPERAANYFQANDAAWDVTKRIRSGEIVPETLNGKKLSPGTLPQDRLAIGALEDQKAQLTEQLHQLTERGSTKVEPAIVAIRTPEEARQIELQIQDVQTQLDALKGKREAATWEDRMVVPMRADTPSSRDLSQYAKEYEKLAKDVERTYVEENGAGHLLAKNALQDWLRTHEDLIPPRMLERAQTASNPGKEVAKHLRSMAQKAAQDVVLPAEEMQKFAELGYKPVLGHSNNFVFSVDPHITEITGLGDYSRRQSFFDSIGLGLNNDSNRGIGQMRSVAMQAAVNDVAERSNLGLSGKQIMTRLWNALKQHDAEGIVTNETVRGFNNIDQSGWSYGPWITPERGRGGPKLFAYDIRNLKPDDVFESLRDIPGFTHDNAMEIYHALKSGGAMGAEMHFLHPLESVRSIAPALRIQGAYGLQDLARTWHAEVIGHVPKEMDGYASALRYTPIKEFVDSAERTRVTKELRSVAVKLGMPAEHEQVATMMLDAMAHGAMQSSPEIYPTADAFFSRLDAGFAERFAGEANNALFKKIGEAPSFDRLRTMAQSFESEKDWYEKGTAALAALPLRGTTTLANGKVINDHELFTQILAAVSPRTTVANSVDLATAAFQSIKRGDTEWPPGFMPAVRGMLDDIVAGKTIDTWGPAREVINGKAVINHGRQKVENFYQNLAGNLDRVTNDSWMAKLFGYDGSITASQYDEITAQVKTLAEDLGWRPAQVQAALWGAVREEAALPMLEEALKADRAGNAADAIAFREAANDMMSMDSFDTFTPKIEAALEKMKGQGPRLLKQVGDDIQGSIQFGPDYSASMRFFRTANLSTLVHEDGHLLRRLLSPQDAHVLERAYGVRVSEFAHESGDVTKMAELVPGESLPLRPIEGDTMRSLYDSATAEKGGFTYNPHTGVTYTEPKGYAVSLSSDSALKLPSDASYEEFQRAVNGLVDHYGEVLGKERVHIGAWNDGEYIHLDPSEVVPTLKEARKLGLDRRQESILRFKDFQEVKLDRSKWSSQPLFSGATKWPTDAEEKFANDVEKYFRERTTAAPHAAQFESLRGALGHLWSRFRGRVNDRNLVDPNVKKLLDGWFGDVFSKLEPTQKPRGVWNPRTRHLAFTTGAGAALGAISGDDKVHDALMGAGGGLALGLGMEHYLNKSYGYLPDHLLRVASALRYSLSPAFDVRRFVKQNLLAGTKYDLPFIGNSRRYITSHFGEGEWNKALEILGQVHGVDYIKDLDTFDRTLYAGGILGYSPVLRQASHAYLLKQRGFSDEKIGLALRELYSYGTGRTPLEKTVNFVFFPFSFEKKLLTTLGDWVLQNPGRNVLIYEGMKRYYQSKTSKEVGDFLERHLPLLSQLNEFNAFSHGLGPGRFMLEGIVGNPDETHRTNAGKVAQVLANFFVPGGGAQTPIQEAIGGFGDIAVNAFSPIAVTGESIARLRSRPGLKNGSVVDQVGDILTGYVPMVKDLNEFWDHAADQLKAFSAGKSPQAQLTDYYNGIASFKSNLAPLAQAMGHSTVDGLMASTAGAPFAAAYQQQKDQLRSENPDAYLMTTRFEDIPSLTNAALRDVLNRTNPTPAEAAIQEIAGVEANFKNVIANTGLDPSMMGPILTEQLRQIAYQHASDPRFQELWDELFAYNYGPIRMVA